MFTPKRHFGDLGEKLAAKYLKEKGYKILDLNFQNAFGRQLGEIDLIARDGETLVFVEVKTREMEKYADTLPEENITQKKLLRLEKIANAYMRLKKLDDAEYRFDALSVWLDSSSKKARIKHIESL